MGGRHKKRGGRVTPKGGSRAHHGTGRLTASERAGLEEIFAKVLRGVRGDLPDDAEAIEAEVWASHLWAVWQRSFMSDVDAVSLFANGLIDHATRRANREGLAVLRALGAVAPRPYASRARSAADRLAAAGMQEPSWASDIGRAAAVSAWLSFDVIHDDGVSVMVGFDGPGGPHTLGVYVDHNMGGLAKDAFGAPTSVAEVVDELRRHQEADDIEYREISLREAAARWTTSIAVTDATFDPPVDQDVLNLRALLLARTAAMPAGGKVPEPPPLTRDERDALLDEFLESDETIGLWGTEGDEDRAETVEHLASQIESFALDYMSGTPLRFSPVMAEIFCLDWAPRKVAADEEAFGLLPDVVAAWIRFVGRRRGIPERPIAEAVDAAYGHAPDMLELARDPSNWGPAKTVGQAILDRGIDITDQAAVDEFIAEINRQGGLDALADSTAPTRRA